MPLFFLAFFTASYMRSKSHIEKEEIKMMLIRVLGYLALIMLIAIAAVCFYVFLLPICLITGPLYLIGFFAVVIIVAVVCGICKKKG